MNRLVLIGNGFDLAHGLNTKYEHFINWYWRKMGENLLGGKGKIVSDGLCSFTLKEDVGLAGWYLVWSFYYKRAYPLEEWDRNFKDMKLMRDRVVNKTFTEPLT